MIQSIVLLFTFIVVLLSLLISNRKTRDFKFPRLSLTIAILFLIVGVPLIISSSNDVSTGLARRSWPVIPAVVYQTDIVGERAFNPQLKCKYRIEGNKYTLTTDLNTPGFGSKRSRRQTAQTILKKYPVGSEVRIHYNPDNPGEAFVRTGPYWSDYMRLGLGVVIFALGLYGILGKTLNKFIRA